MIPHFKHKQRAMNMNRYTNAELADVLFRQLKWTSRATIEGTGRPRTARIPIMEEGVLLAVNQNPGPVYGRLPLQPEDLGQLYIRDDRWRHHLSPPPQFRHGIEGEGNVLQFPALVTQPTRLSDPLISRARTSCVLGGYLRASGIEPRPSGQESDALTSRLPTAQTEVLICINPNLHRESFST
ncbi:hypothetical protein TNCV_3235121 [Trichonephila clavipes]|nr:hypothetical protein TNCV_3235121 [Trichonephila clavipes]